MIYPVDSVIHFSNNRGQIFMDHPSPTTAARKKTLNVQKRQCWKIYPDKYIL